MAKDAAYWQQRAAFYAQKYGIDPKVFVAQIRQESGFNPNAHSSAGAQGIAQIMPFWHIGTNPENQLNWAAQHDAQNLRKYGNWKDALSIYNSGRGWSTGQKIGETSNYVRSILGGVGSPSTSVGPGSAPGGAQTPSAGPQGVDFRKLGAMMLLGGPTSSNDLLSLALQRQQYGAAQQQFGNMGGGGLVNRQPQVKGKTLGMIEQFAAPYGLSVTSTTGGQHAPNSYHYQGRAVDFGGNPNHMASLAKAALKSGNWSEFIYTGPGNPGYSILGGKVIPNNQLPQSLYAQHENHVHLAK